MTWPKRVVISIALLGVYGTIFLVFLLPQVAWWLPLATVVVLIPLFVSSLKALYQLRWKMITIFAVVWILLILPFTRFQAVLGPLGRLGFYVHTLLDHDYLAKCRLTDFIENGVKQTVGFCEGFNRGESSDVIVYDTTARSFCPSRRERPSGNG